MSDIQKRLDACWREPSTPVCYIPLIRDTACYMLQLESELSATKEKLELAEKRISESQEQEPTVAIEVSDTGHRITWSEADQLPNGLWPMFIEPPIPPELAELQREMGDREARLTAEYVKELEAFRLENAELRAQLKAKEPEVYYLDH